MENSAMTDGSSAATKTAQVKGRRAAGNSKPKNELVASAPLTQKPAMPPGKRSKTGDAKARSHLEKGISELQGLHGLLLTNEVDPDVLSDFRDALNRVRNTAWAAQQYVVRKESDQDSTSVLSFLAGERLRVAYQVCQALSDDLKRTDVEFQRGSLVQLYEIATILTEKLKSVIDKL
jgi:hypothetical protein